jgi:very-short-patch-repair endonuclease
MGPPWEDPERGESRRQSTFLRYAIESASADAAVAEIAGRQHGVVTSRQLLAAGLSTAGISRRLTASRLHRVHRGVYAVGHLALSREALWVAAILACGGGPLRDAGRIAVLRRWGAALSHSSAARLWGLIDSSDSVVHVSVPTNNGRRAPAGIVLHRRAALSPREVTSCGGIPATTPPRTLSDLRASAPEALWRRAEREAAVLGLRAAEAGSGDRTRSDLEAEFLTLCARHRLPAPEVNVRVGPYLVDFLWRERRLVAETDSYLYHRGRVAFADDHARDLALRELGHDVIRVDERQIEAEPARIARLLRAELLRAAAPGSGAIRSDAGRQLKSRPVLRSGRSG